MSPRTLLRILLLSALVGALAGLMDTLRIALLHPESIADRVGCLVWILQYLGLGVLLLGLPLTLVHALLGRWLPAPGLLALLVQMAAVVYALWESFRLGPLPQVLAEGAWWSEGSLRALDRVLGVGAVALFATLLLRPPRGERRVARPLLVLIALVVAAGPWLAVWLVPQGPAAGSLARRPHVVFIVLDTVRADEFFAATQDPEIAPRMAQLAAEGITYSNVLATSTWTLPTHASMFTGLMPRSHGARVPDLNLAPDCHTLSELLREAGYATACISNNPWISESFGMHQGFDHLWDPWGLIRHLPWARTLWDRYRYKLAATRLTGVPHGDKNARYTVELAEHWLRCQQSREPEQPMFLFLNFMNAHLPYLPPQPYPLRFLGPEDGRNPEKYGHVGGELDPGRNKINRLRAEGLRKLYRASIAYLDEVVGRLVDELVRMDLLDDTLLIIASDHGEHIGEHGLLGHAGPPWKTTTWVPLILRFPPRLEAGRVDDRLASQVDLFPTILELTHLHEKIPTLGYALQGTSLLEPSPRSFVVSEFFGDPDWTDSAAGESLNSACLLTSEHRLLWRDVQGYELLERGAGDRPDTDVTASQPATLEELRERFERWRELMPKIQGTAAEITAEELARLRELGYL